MSHGRGSQGVTLIEMAIVVTVVGILLGIGAQSARVWLERQREVAVQIKLDAVEDALVAFVATNARLPCPWIVNGGGAAGAEAATCANQLQGVVPYQTLGLPRDAAVDPWGNYFTYRVDPDLTVGTAMDMTNCKAAEDPRQDGTGYELANCVTDAAPANFLSGLGLEVRNDAGTVLNNPAGVYDTQPPTGAAYVLISHGRNRAGGITLGGVPHATAAQNNEAINAATENLQTSYRDQPTSNAFDDYVRRPTVLSVAVEAGLGPRN